MPVPASLTDLAASLAAEALRAPALQRGLQAHLGATLAPSDRPCLTVRLSPAP